MTLTARSLDQLADRHHPHPRPSTACSRRTAVTPAPRWAPRRWRTCCGPGSCATRRPDPDWFDRDRFVLSAGHASMLLYSLLHLTGYDLPLEELKRFRQFGSRTPGPSRVRPDAGRRGDHRAARPGLRQRRRHGHRGAPAGRRVQSPGHDARRPPDVRHLLRRRPPGGHQRRGGQPRRPSAPGQAGVPLRRQRDPARRPDLDGLSARTCRPLRRLRLAHPAGRATATTSRPSRRPSRPREADDRPSLIAVRTHIGYGSPNRQDTQKAHGAAARAGRGPPDQGGLRLGSRRDLLHPGRRRSRTSARPSPAGEELVADWDDAARRAYAAADPPSRGRARAGASPGSCPTDWDARPAGRMRTAPTRLAHAQRLAGTRSRRWQAALPELFGGAADLSESNLTDLKGGGDFTATEAGPQHPVRRPRARHGRHRQRHRVPRRLHALCRRRS